MTDTHIHYEAGSWLVVSKGNKVLFRCPVQHTDWRDNEPLHGFVGRHGGLIETRNYLQSCVAHAL